MADFRRRVVDLMDIGDQNKEKIGLLSLDIFKAFGSLQWKNIRNYGFGDKFVTLINQLYQKRSYARVKVNEDFTDDIKFEAGIKQGCPLSPVLFIMAMELLAESIREDKVINGIEGMKISLYADDTLIIKNPIKGLERIQVHLNEFEEMTELKVNWDKSEAIFCNVAEEEQIEIKRKRSTVEPRLTNLIHSNCSFRS